MVYLGELRKMDNETEAMKRAKLSLFQQKAYFIWTLLEHKTEKRAKPVTTFNVLFQGNSLMR